MPATLARPNVAVHNRIQQILESLRRAESEEVIRDRRLADRRPFVRPVVITLGREQRTVIQATSNNLSKTGIGLVHEEELREGRIGVLTIYRLHEDPVRVRADVRWCQPFCGLWHTSGWRFLAEESH